MIGEWRTAAEWDWVELGRGDRLHAVDRVTNDADTDWGGEGTTVCGRAGWMWIPGLGMRMGATRCRRCCERAGMPHGAASPKNVGRCRPIVRARIAALEADSAIASTEVSSR